MRTGITVGSYMHDNNDTEGLKRMKKHGYDAMDYNTLCNTDIYLYHCSDEEFVKELKKIRKTINDEGIEIYQTHGPWRWPVQDSTEEDRAERFEKMAKAIKATGILGAKYFVIHPIMPFGIYSNPEPEKYWEINREFFTRLTKVGEENGVIVCLENMPMPALTTSTPSQTLKMVKEINSPWIKVCLDTGHCSVLGLSPADAVREIGKEYLATLHVHDNSGEYDRDYHWIPYTGVIDWKDFASALKEIGFDGVLSLETDIVHNLHLPEELKEYFEIGLAKMAKHLTE